MTQRTRMVLLKLFGPAVPAVLTVAFFLATLVPLALLGMTYPPERVVVGVIFYFGFWQIGLVALEELARAALRRLAAQPLPHRIH